MLKKQYDEKLAQKEELRKRSEEMEVKLERAGLLVSGLAGEKARWEETVQVTSAPPTARPPHPLPAPTSSQSSTHFWLRDSQGTRGHLGMGAGTSECGVGVLPLFQEKSRRKDLCAL